MKDHEDDFAGLLVRYRGHAGLTQQELANKIGVHRRTIDNWENRASWPQSREQVLRLADELFLFGEERKAFVQAGGFSVERWPTEVWIVPQQRDMFFTGRDDVFQSLRQLLVPGSTAALTQAISGLGGIGKTHTAIEYAYRFHQYYEAVLWLQADSWEVLVSECIKLADELGLPERKEADQVVAQVQQWLRKHRHWLLILDNVENPQEILSKLVPTRHQGCVLVTTRVRDVEPLAQTQVLSIMPEDEGTLFLLRRTKRIASRAALEQANWAQRDEAQQIWQLMDGLPLALDQAGAYILETGCSFLAYQEQYTRRRTELLHRRGKRFIGHEASVATTFSLAFERFEALNPVAADILRVCSLLHSEAIPEELFQEGVERLGLRLAAERDNWDTAIGVLQDYSLVQRNPDTKTLTVHRLVQAVLRDAMGEETQREWAERVMRAIHYVFPRPEFANWPRCQRYLLHAQTCATLIARWDLMFPEAVSLLNAVGVYLYQRSQYAQVESLYLQALNINEWLWGPIHPNTSRILNNLAELYRIQSKYAQAEHFYLRAQAINEKASGIDFLDVATDFNNLALLYHTQGKYAEAEPLFQRALMIDETVLGTGHPRVAIDLENLAELYRAQGKYAEAEPLFQRALSICEQVLDPNHPEVARSLHCLATLYHDQGKDAQAELLLRRALTIREQALGPDHYEVATSLNNLATLCAAQDKYAEAEHFYSRALAIREQVLGSNHPYTAQSLNDLAVLYASQGKYAEAEPLFQRALHIWEQVLGAEDSNVAYPLTSLATLYRNQGKYEQAEPLYQRALHIHKQALGDNHPKTREMLNRYIALLQAMGRHEEAILLGVKCAKLT